MAVNVLLVLEQPWWGIDQNPSQASVIPFFEGLARLKDCRLYTANFFGLDGFRQGLAHLAEAAERHANGRFYLYIAAHGKQRKLGSDKYGSGIRLDTAMMEIKLLADQIKRSVHGEHGLEGCIIGSCQLGQHESDFHQLLTGTTMRWSVGYRHSLDWLPSTQIDLALMAAMIGGNRTYQESDDGLVERFVDALRLFDPLAEIADDHKDGWTRRSLQETITVVVQAKGKGKRPWTVDAEDLWPNDEDEEEPVVYVKPFSHFPP